MLQHSARKLIVLALVFYLGLVIAIFGLLWHKTGGHFCYSIDDPYIHMALADQIHQGHYGLNASEASSPSSSLLWPYLLAPFAGMSWSLYVPLVWNLIFGIVSACLIGYEVNAWPEREPANHPWAKPMTVVTLVIAGNLPGTVFLGMEHGLQVMLALCCGVGLIRALDGRRIPMWCIAAAAIAPMVRYEGLSLTLVVGVALWGERRRGTAAAMGLVSVVPLAVFSSYLHGLGLPLLPLSVLVKGGVSSAHVNVVVAFAKLILSGAFNVVANAKRWPLLMLAILLAPAAYRKSERTRRLVFVGVSVAAVLNMLLNHVGSLHRYELYILVLAAMVTLRWLQEKPLPRLAWYGLGLAALVLPVARTIPDFVQSADDVYGQQYQMHRFATEFYGGNVAAGDIGVVSYGLGSGRYVLDLGGLASMEVAKAKDRSPAWMERIAREHSVGLAMMYAPREVPPDWRRMGEICLGTKPTELAEQCVNFYATSAEELPKLASSFRAFSKTLPPETFAIVTAP